MGFEIPGCDNELPGFPLIVFLIMFFKPQSSLKGSVGFPARLICAGIRRLVLIVFFETWRRLVGTKHSSENGDNGGSEYQKV